MSDWIRVTDKMPEVGVIVLFWDDRFEEMMIGSYSGDKQYWLPEYADSYTSGITYWRPLPEGPECTLT